MNISYNWLKKYIAADLSAEAMATILTDIGLEVESFEKIETVRGGLQGVVVGEVLTCEKHPDSDHLHVTTVDVGAPEPLRIVCGAPNCRKGLKVLCATVGAVLYPEGGDEAFKIKRSKIRGVESLGMLCAEDELGIGASHDGIMELPADAPVGMPAKEYLHIEDDYLIGVGLTPNRVDAASHIGVARDLAAYLRAKGDAEARVLWPDVSAFAVDDHALEIGVTVENAEAAPRYTGVTITGCKIGPSPDWMQNALRAAGIEPGLRHVACSAASEQYPEYCLDAVRVGRRLFMDAPTAPRGDILEVSTWRSFVTMVHPRRAGEQIGYGGAVTLAHDALIATVGVGYGDGLNPALASAKAPVLIGRKRCTLLACCMDQCLIDVTGTDCRPGDEVVFFGYDRFGNCLPSQEVALLIGGDEGCGLTAALSPRVVRAYSS